MSTDQLLRIAGAAAAVLALAIAPVRAAADQRDGDPSPMSPSGSLTQAGELSGVVIDKRGCVVVDPATGVTGNAKVWSGGDCTNGGKEVVNAVADGRNAARAMMAGWNGGARPGAERA